MQIKRHRLNGITLSDVLIATILLVLALLFLYPIYYIFVAAFSDPLDMFKNPIIILPRNISFYNVNMLMQSAGVWMGYRNTIIYVVLGTTINVIATILTAYALAQPNLPFRKVFSFLIVFTMFFSGGMIPSFLIVKGLGMLNTVWSLVLPGAISTWNLLIARTYLMQQIPYELHEAAEIDGAGEYRTFLQIVLPLAKPIIVVIILFYASAHWNAWFNAMIYLRDRALYPLQIFLREMLIDQTSGGMLADNESDKAIYMLTLKYAVMGISILPLMLIFPFVQKYFVKGVMIGAIKG